MKEGIEREMKRANEMTREYAWEGSHFNYELRPPNPHPRPLQTGGGESVLECKARQRERERERERVGERDVSSPMRGIFCPSFCMDVRASPACTCPHCPPSLILIFLFETLFFIFLIIFFNEKLYEY